MQDNNIITVQNLSVSFGANQILNDVSMSINRGEVTVILGASGSGKTTVLKHLLGLYAIQDGEIVVLGKSLNNLDEAQQKASYLNLGVFYQNGGLLNSLTVAENVALPLQQHTELPEEIINNLVRLKLSLVNMEHAYHMFPSQLSGGMLKRAALARAIIMDPPLLFCDEPGAGLDPVSLKALDRLLLDLKALLGITVVLVTHEVSSIRRVADRIIFLDQGRIIFEGTLDEALNSNLPAIASFFSSDTPGNN